MGCSQFRQEVGNMGWYNGLGGFLFPIWQSFPQHADFKVGTPDTVLFKVRGGGGQGAGRAT